MKALDIINQLQVVLPQITDKFTTSVEAVSITPSGLVATVLTSSDHEFSADNVVSISGAFAPVEIATIIRSGTVATATTVTAHDLTDDFFENVTLSGANEAEFNGTFPFITQVNRNTFTFTVADSGPTTGTGTMLLEDPGSPYGYNGLQTIVTVPSLTSFTYALEEVLTQAATGTILIHSGLRITGAATLERAEAMYTKKETDELWAFVVLDDTFASKDRTSRNDAVSSIAPGADRRQQIIQAASVYIFASTTDDLSGRETKDLMVDIRAFLLKALNGVKFDSDLAAQEGMGLIYNSDGIELYNNAIYVHRFEFQLLASITNVDTVDPDFNVAFRDIDVTMATNLGTEELLASIDLDDEPL